MDLGRFRGPLHFALNLIQAQQLSTVYAPGIPDTQQCGEGGSWPKMENSGGGPQPEVLGPWNYPWNMSNLPQTLNMNQLSLFLRLCILEDTMILFKYDS